MSDRFLTHSLVQKKLKAGFKYAVVVIKATEHGWKVGEVSSFHKTLHSAKNKSAVIHGTGKVFVLGERNTLPI